MLSNSLIPYRALKETFSKGYVVEKHYHPYFHMLYVTSGKLEITCNDKQYIVDEGHAALIAPNVPHMFVAAEATRSIEFKFACENHLKAFGSSLVTSPAFIWEPTKKSVDLMYEAMEEAEAKNPYYMEMISAKLYSILLRLLRIRDDQENVLKTIQEGERLIPDSVENSELGNIIAYIREHFTEPILIRDVANKFGYSTSYFTKVFRNVTGITPHQYVTILKMELAKQLIRKGTMNISAISNFLNFSNISAFTNTFKKFNGMTPSEFAQYAQECTYITLADAPDVTNHNIRCISPMLAKDTAKHLK